MMHIQQPITSPDRCAVSPGFCQISKRSTFKGLSHVGVAQRSAAAAAPQARRYVLTSAGWDRYYGIKDVTKPKDPPPDVPSALLLNRILFLSSPIVPIVCENLIAQIMYLNYVDKKQPFYFYINSPGVQRETGEVVSFDFDAFAIHDTMKYMKNPIYTFCFGIAFNHAAMLLAAGDKGKRYMTPQATVMLADPQIYPTGQRYAEELYDTWEMVADRKDIYLEILSQGTGRSKALLDYDMRHPLYMYAQDAQAYGIVDHIAKKRGAQLGVQVDYKT